MSYMTDKFNNGEVHVKEDGACGWLFDNGEFRPLMADAMYELLDAGLVTYEQCQTTEVVRVAHEKAFLKDYVEQQEKFWNDPEFEDARREQEFEMRAAFGEGAEVVNVLTGRKIKV
jgi:hypothetical protein